MSNQLTVAQQNSRTIREVFSKEKTQRRIQEVIPKHMDASRMLRIASAAIHDTPNLILCHPNSLLGSVMTCATLGLEPNTPLQHCHLVPFKRNVKDPETGGWSERYDVELIIGYRGYIDLARRSGHTVNIHGDVAYARDDFDHEHGSENFLKHKPKLFTLEGGVYKIVEERGPIIAAYAHAKLTNGESFTVMPIADVNKIRDQSQGYANALRQKQTADKNNRPAPKGWTKCPWVAHYPAMASKSAIRNLAKELPLSLEMASAVSLDQAPVDYGKVLELGDAEVQETDLSSLTYDEEVDQETGEVTPAAVDPREEGITGTGETNVPDDAEEKAKTTRRRVKITFREKELPKTNFLRDVKFLINKAASLSDLAELQNEVNEACTQAGERGVADELAAVFKKRFHVLDEASAPESSGNQDPLPSDPLAELDDDDDLS